MRVPAGTSGIPAIHPYHAFMKPYSPLNVHLNGIHHRIVACSYAVFGHSLIFLWQVDQWQFLSGTQYWQLFNQRFNHWIIGVRFIVLGCPWIFTNCDLFFGCWVLPACRKPNTQEVVSESIVGLQATAINKVPPSKKNRKGCGKPNHQESNITHLLFFRTFQHPGAHLHPSCRIASRFAWDLAKSSATWDPSCRSNKTYYLVGGFFWNPQYCSKFICTNMYNCLPYGFLGFLGYPQFSSMSCSDCHFFHIFYHPKKGDPPWNPPWWADPVPTPRRRVKAGTAEVCPWKMSSAWISMLPHAPGPCTKE